MQEPGLLSLSTLQNRVQEGSIDTVILAFTDHYGRLMGKRFDAHFFLDKVAEKGSHACDYLLTTDMEMEPVPGYSFANWELGYGDFHLNPALETLRLCSWLAGTALVLSDVVAEDTHEQGAVAPRSMLTRQVEILQNKGFMGKAASELEFYLFDTDYRTASATNYQGLAQSGDYLEDYHLLAGTRNEPYYRAVRKHLAASGIPVEGTKGEWGIGQHEINIRYAEIGEMADRHVVVKQCMKEVADSMGRSVSFMAKYHHDQAGSSCHIHLSLWQEGKNAFVGEKDFGPVKGSDIFGWFLGGWMQYVPEMMVFYAPTINSYKRYQDSSWAPTRLAWSLDNRTAGFRVVGKGESLRIECRIPGADTNPYLAFAAALASGIAGIEQRLDPPPCFQGDVYAAKELPTVPRNLKEATENFAASNLVREAMGKEVQAHYAHFFRTEVQAFEGVVTDWERKRYFERI